MINVQQVRLPICFTFSWQRTKTVNWNQPFCIIYIVADAHDFFQKVKIEKYCFEILALSVIRNLGLAKNWNMKLKNACEKHEDEPHPSTIKTHTPKSFPKEKTSNWFCLRIIFIGDEHTEKNIWKMFICASISSTYLGVFFVCLQLSVCLRTHKWILAKGCAMNNDETLNIHVL